MKTSDLVDRMGGVARLVMAMDGGRLGGYSVLVFTGWDHGLQDQQAAKLKHNNLRYRLQVSASSCPGGASINNRIDFSAPLQSFLGLENPNPNPISLSLFFPSQVDLEEERIKKKADSLTLSQVFFLYSLRIFLHLIVLAMIVGAFVAISSATQYSQVYLC